MPQVQCWRCGRIIAEVRQEGGDYTIKCPRCHAPNRIGEAA